LNKREKIYFTINYKNNLMKIKSKSKDKKMKSAAKGSFVSRKKYQQMRVKV